MESSNKKNIDFVLSGGGPKGAGHAGFLKAVEQSKVRLGKGTGISIGAVVLTFHANGYSPDEIRQILQLQFDRLRDCSNNKSCLRWPSLIELLNGELLDMLPVFRQLCAEYKLKPQANMQIIAYDILHQRPKVFSSTDYDLAKALTASCALPGIMRPVVAGKAKTIKSWKQFVAVYESMRKSTNENEGIYFDGFLHHPFAYDYSSKPVIISRLGMGSTITSERWSQLKPADLTFHMLEMLLSRLALIPASVPEPCEGLVIDTGLPSIASVAWDLPPQIHQELFDHGFRATLKSIKAARNSKWLNSEFIDD
jgi:hypothetical protein